MASTLVRPWTNFQDLSETGPVVPALELLFFTQNGTRLFELFLVDSGADYSLAPKRLCDELGLDWESGEPITLAGISPKPECTVSARILDVPIQFPELDATLTIPICFTEGDSSLLLG